MTVSKALCCHGRIGVTVSKALCCHGRIVVTVSKALCCHSRIVVAVSKAFCCHGSNGVAAKRLSHPKGRNDVAAKKVIHPQDGCTYKTLFDLLFDNGLYLIAEIRKGIKQRFAGKTERALNQPDGVTVVLNEMRKKYFKT